MASSCSWCSHDWLCQNKSSCLLGGQVEEFLARSHAPHKLAKGHLHLAALAEALARTGPLLHTDACSALQLQRSQGRCSRLHNYTACGIHSFTWQRG